MILLYADPQTRISQAGKPFTTAGIRAVGGENGGCIWVNLTAFGELGDRLAALKANNAVAVSGRLEVSAYTDKRGDVEAEKQTANEPNFLLKTLYRFE